jgi:ketosteroid isomerase-like protein
VEIVRDLYAAMNARDLKAAVEFVHPEVEWIPDRRVGEGPIRGRESVLRFFTDTAEMFDHLVAEIERLSEIDDRVLAFIRVEGSGGLSGAGFDIRIGHLWTLRDGLVIRGEGYGSRAEALAAVGLRE